MLLVLSGLPGVGKTTIARELAAAMGAVHVRIDSDSERLVIDTARMDVRESVQSILSALGNVTYK